MGAIGALAVNLTVRTANFGRGMKGARRHIQQLGQSVSNVSSKIKMFAGALVTAAGIGGLGYTIKRSFDAIDALGKTSAKLGIATEKLGGLHHAAGLAGVNVRTMDMAVQRMTRRLSEAAIGTGEARAAIKELGLDAKALVKLTPDVALERIADAMSNVKRQSDRVRLSFKLFDSEGVAMVNMLMDGSKALQAAHKDFGRLGGAITGIDVAKIELAKNAVQRMKTAATAVANAIAWHAAPYIKALADRMVDFGTIGGGAVGLVSTAFDAMRGSIVFVAEALDGLIYGYKKLKLLIVESALGWLGIAERLTRGRWMAGIADDIKAFRHEIGEAMIELLPMRAELAKDIGKYLLGPGLGKETRAIFEDIERRAAKAAKAMADGLAGMRGMGAFAPLGDVAGAAAKTIKIEPIAAAQRGTQEAFSAIREYRERQRSIAQKTLQELTIIKGLLPGLIRSNEQIERNTLGLEPMVEERMA